MGGGAGEVTVDGSVYDHHKKRGLSTAAAYMTRATPLPDKVRPGRDTGYAEAILWATKAAAKGQAA
jgi:hypothetical protein